jgi:hypothetical protein
MQAALKGLSLRMLAGNFPADVVQQGGGNTRSLLSWSLGAANTTREAYLKTLHEQWTVHAGRARNLESNRDHLAAIHEWMSALALAPWREECRQGLRAAALQIGDERVLHAEKVMRLIPQPPVMDGEGLRFVELMLDGTNGSCFLATAPPDSVIVRCDICTGSEVSRSIS